MLYRRNGVALSAAGSGLAVCACQLLFSRLLRNMVCGVSIAQLQLERVLGMTCVHNSSLAVNNVTGEIAYPAGCIVVVYNPKRNRQVRLAHACCDGA